MLKHHQWLTLRRPPEILPLEDLREHVEGEQCWCEPFERDGVLVHVSADRRELTEQRPS